MMPSPCGITTAESRDFKVATYSVVSSIFSAFAVCTFTGMACGASAFAALLLPQPAVERSSASSAPGAIPAKTLLTVDAGVRGKNNDGDIVVRGLNRTILD